MSEIKKAAIAGTLESSDVQITMEPNPGGGRNITLHSIVKMQFGDSILATVNRVLDDFDIRDARITINDKGAIDVVIMSRMQAVICRACKLRYRWDKEDPHGK